MKVIGIAGGVASGKSQVAAELERLGALRLDADRAGHEVLTLDHVRAAIRQRWGDDVFDENGQVNRSAVAKIVFGNEESAGAELAALEAITHPEIGRLLERQLATWREGNVTPAVVLDAPVMFKAGWHKYCDSIWYVDATDATRLARAETRGWCESDFRARELSQTSLAEKREFADIVIDNNGTRRELTEQIQNAWRQLGLNISMTDGTATSSFEGFLSSPA